MNQPSQDPVIRQLIRDNLRLQAQTRMLIGIVATCITGPMRWNPTEMTMYMNGELIDEMMARKLDKMLGLAVDQVLEMSPLAEGLSDEELKQVKNFE